MIPYEQINNNQLSITRSIEECGIEATPNCFSWQNDNSGHEQDVNENVKLRVYLPLVSTAPNSVCWQQVDGSIEGNPTELYTIRFDNGGSISSLNSELTLPRVPVQVYSWVQGYDVEFVGNASICKYSPMQDRTSFLVDGVDAEKINTNDGAIFELPANIDYASEPNSRTYIQIIADNTAGEYYFFVMPDLNNPDYQPNYNFRRSVNAAGYRKVRVIQNDSSKLILKNLDNDGQFLYIDEESVEVPPAPVIP